MSVLIQLLQDPDSCFLRFSCLRTLKVYYSKLLFYRPEAMQLCMEERVIEAVSLTPSPPPGRGVGLVCLHAVYPLGHVRSEGACLEDIPMSCCASGCPSVACSDPRG